MPKRTLKFRIRQDGLVEETVEGIEGQSCDQITKRIEEALGSVQTHEPTSEAYLQPQLKTQSISAEIH